MTMNMNDVYVAQERYADMRREAAQENANAQMMGGMAPVGSNMVASVIERMRQAVRSVQAATGRLVVQEQ
jgi:hypothetical protein